MVKKIKNILIMPFLVLSFSALVPASAFAAIDCEDPANKDKIQCNPITQDINSIVNFLSIGVGVVVIAMLILGGIQYSMAGDKPEAVNAAKQRLINAVIALAAYLLIFAFLQWLVPGGVF